MNSARPLEVFRFTQPPMVTFVGLLKVLLMVTESPFPSRVRDRPSSCIGDGGRVADKGTVLSRSNALVIRSATFKGIPTLHVGRESCLDDQVDVTIEVTDRSIGQSVQAALMSLSVPTMTMPPLPLLPPGKVNPLFGKGSMFLRGPTS